MTRINIWNIIVYFCYDIFDLNVYGFDFISPYDMTKFPRSNNGNFNSGVVEFTIIYQLDYVFDAFYDVLKYIPVGVIVSQIKTTCLTSPIAFKFLALQTTSSTLSHAMRNITVCVSEQRFHVFIYLRRPFAIDMSIINVDDFGCFIKCYCIN